MIECKPLHTGSVEQMMIHKTDFRDDIIIYYQNYLGFIANKTSNRNQNLSAPQINENENNSCHERYIIEGNTSLHDCRPLH